MSADILTVTIISIYRDIVEARELIMIRQLLEELHERVNRLQNIEINKLIKNQTHSRNNRPLKRMLFKYICRGLDHI